MNCDSDNESVGSLRDYAQNFQEENCREFMVLAAWQATVVLQASPKRHNSKMSKYHKGSLSILELTEDNDSDIDQDDAFTDGSCVSRARRWWHRTQRQKVPLEPQSYLRILWDLISWFFVVYEIITTPLAFFELPSNRFLETVPWGSRIFWTCDVALSMLTGYSGSHGLVERRLWHVVQKYLRTWFAIDVTLCALDWMEMVAGGLDKAANMGRTLKVVRILRMLRLLRMIRLMRMPEFLKSLAYYFRSEVSQIMLGLLKIMIFVVIINHVMGCSWFGVGVGTSGEEGSWVERYGLEERTLSYKYATSFHWSLTQFTGSMEIYPVNTLERWYAISTLFITFLISAYAVSRITSSLTRLEIVTAQQISRMADLKQFLFDNQISRRVALSVQRNAQHALTQEKRHVAAESIELLSMISEPLQVELHFEMYMPKFCSNPFMARFGEVYPTQMREICHTAVSLVSLSSGDVLFSDGETPPTPTMYVLISGKAQYLQEETLIEDASIVRERQCLCEAALWTHWVHCGILLSKAPCRLLSLDASVFQDIVTSSVPEHDLTKLRAYPQRYVDHLTTCPVQELTDLEDPAMPVGDWVHEAFAGMRKIDRRPTQAGRLRKSKMADFSSIGFGGGRPSKIIPC